MIEKWDCQAKMEHPVSWTRSHMLWLGYPRGFRAVATSDNHLDDEVVELRKLDGARINPHIPYTPDDGGYYYPRTLELGGCSNHYDVHLLERDGVLGFIPPSLLIQMLRYITPWCC